MVISPGEHFGIPYILLSLSFQLCISVVSMLQSLSFTPEDREDHLPVHGPCSGSDSDYSEYLDSGGKGAQSDDEMDDEDEAAGASEENSSEPESDYIEPRKLTGRTTTRRRAVRTPKRTLSGLQECEVHLSKATANLDTMSLQDADALFDGNNYPAEYYRKGLEEFQDEVYDRKEYSAGTEGLISMAHGQWSRYAHDPIAKIQSTNKLTRGRFCAKILQTDWRLTYQNITFRVIYQFLDWVLNQRAGTNGRAKRGIRKKSSLVTFWCVFRLAFERATTFKVDTVINHHRLKNV